MSKRSFCEVFEVEEEEEGEGANLSAPQRKRPQAGKAVASLNAIFTMRKLLDGPQLEVVDLPALSGSWPSFEAIPAREAWMSLGFHLAQAVRCNQRDSVQAVNRLIVLRQCQLGEARRRKMQTATNQ